MQTHPSAIDVERSVLASMIIDENALDDAMELLNDDVFHHGVHQKIFICLQELYKNDKEKGDVKFAEVLTELADYAAKYNVKLAVYPHFSFYCETFSHTLKLVKMANRPNLGAVFNLCHFLKVQGQANLEEQLKEGIPYLFMVSLSGADTGDTQKMDWDRLIQPLGKGSFDPYPIVKLLKDNNYKGKFGLQCYNIKMDCEPALTQSMNTWKTYKKRYSKEKR